MARIAGIDLPRRKRIDIALTYIYGIGRSTALEILQKSGIEGSVKTDEMTEDEVRRIRDVLEAEYKVEGDLREAIAAALEMTCSYLGEPTKMRIVHGGSEMFHVYHLHGGAMRLTGEKGKGAVAVVELPR